jgi:hypothetical protein
MPQPIVPIHRQENMPILFEQTNPEFPLSEIQATLLQPTAADLRKKTTGLSTIQALEEIDKNPESVFGSVHSANERYCSVPNHMDENTILSLKAEGFISGNGRSVKITDRGRTALRDHYLNKSNKLKDDRVSDKFDYNSFSRIASKNVASFSNDNNKSFFKKCMKLAYQKTASQNTTDIFINFIKIAQRSKEEIKEKLYLVSERINDAKSSFLSDDEKEERVSQILKNNAVIIYEYINAFALNEELKDRALDYLGKRFFQEAPKKLLDLGEPVELIGWLNGLLNTAFRQVKQKDKSDAARKKENEEKATQKLQSLPQSTSFDENLPIDEQIDEITEKLKELSEKDLYVQIPLLSFIKNFENLKNKFNLGENIQSEFQSEKQFLNVFLNNYFLKHGKMVDDEIKFKLNEMLKTSFWNEIDDLAEHLLNFEYASLSKNLIELSEADRRLAKLVISNIIKASIIMDTAAHNEIPISKVFREELAGKGVPKKTHILNHVFAPLIEIELRKLEQDPEKLKTLLEKAMNAMAYGKEEREKGSKAYHHVVRKVPLFLLRSELAKARQEEFGGSLANLTEDQIVNLAEVILNKLHNIEKAHIEGALPGANKFNYMKVPVQGQEETIKNSIIDEIKRIKNEDVEKLSKNETSSSEKLSSLQILLKKYASYKIYC